MPAGNVQSGYGRVGIIVSLQKTLTIVFTVEIERNASLSELGLAKFKNGEYRRILLQRCSRVKLIEIGRQIITEILKGSSEETIPCQIYLLQYYIQDYSGILTKTTVSAMIVIFVLSLVLRYF